MKTITLSNCSTSFVDDDDFELVSKYRWHIHPVGYVQCPFHYLKDGKRKHINYLMHRLIMNPAKGLEVDHIDGNKLNNQRANLRVCTRSQNLCNQRLRSDTGSGYKGVYRAGNRFTASIMADGRRHWLGSYGSAEEAAAAYDCASVRWHGEFGLTNRALGLLPDK